MMQSMPHNSVHTWPTSTTKGASGDNICATGACQVWCRSYKPQGVDNSESATVAPARILLTHPCCSPGLITLSILGQPVFPKVPQVPIYVLQGLAKFGACTLTPGCGQHSKCNNCPCQDSTHSPMLQSRPHNSVHPAFPQVLHVPIYVLQGLARFGAGPLSPRVWTTVKVQQLPLPEFCTLTPAAVQAS
jgi:hypothetical protein